jgi:hypothetical protein
MTRTKVLNVTGLVLTGLAFLFHFTYTDADVGAIALLVWSAVNLFTEGGLHERKLSATVVVNGLGAALGIATAAGWIHLSGTQTSQVLMLASQAVNLLFTEGGVMPDKSVAGTVALLLFLAPTILGCGHGTAITLPDPDTVLTADNANEVLVKAEALRVVARDAVAEAKVAGRISDATVAEFAKYDKLFTDAYGRARAAVNAGAIEKFRSEYRGLRDLMKQLAALAGGAK